MITSNVFLVFEGIDGSGKSTAARSLFNNETILQGTKILEFEPTNISESGKTLRKILENERNITNELNQKMLDLFYKDRMWHIENIIEPALKSGKHVILDRYYYSTAAYQGTDSMHSMNIALEYLNDKSVIQPDIVFYFDLSPEISLKRTVKRGHIKELFDKKNILEKVRTRYLHIFNEIPDINVCFIKAEKSEEEIINEIKMEIMKKSPL